MTRKMKNTGKSIVTGPPSEAASTSVSPGNSIVMKLSRDQMVLSSLIRGRAREMPNKVYLEFEEEKITFADLDSITNRVANGFKALGVHKGDHVCIILANCTEYIFAWFALAKIGAVAVFVNVVLRGGGLAYVLKNSDAKFLILHANMEEHVNLALEGSEQMPQRVIVGSDKTPGTDDRSIIAWSKLLSSSADPPDEDVKPWDLHSILYTSGTTGMPKGALLCHYYMWVAAVQSARVVGLRNDDRYHLTLPLYHMNPQLVAYECLMCGATVLLRRGFSASSFWSDVRTHRATIIDCMGVMPMLLYNQPAQPGEGDNSVRVGLMLPCPRNVHDSLSKRFNMKIVTGYGSTEGGFPVIFTTDSDPKKAGSTGRVWGPIKLRIVDEHDFELPTGKVGEIIVRSDEPWVLFSGYYKNPEATLDAFGNSWFHTGDRGYIDSEGYLWYVDRKKEAIRRSGEMLSPVEIETTIGAHPAIAEVAAVGVPAELGDEDIKIVVVLKPGASVSPEELLRFCEGKIAYFMIPRYVEFKESMPKTPTERIEKYKLKKEGVTPATWDRVAAGYKVSRV